MARRLKPDLEKISQVNLNLKKQIIVDLGKDKIQELGEDLIKKEHKKYLKFNKL
jgi:hypothetical protein